MEVVQFVTDALGDASYLVVSGGHAAVIDPQRDVREVVAAAAARNATIDFVFETHVHNDYLSGGRELAERGARIVAPAGGKYEFPHLPVKDGEAISLGGASIRAVSAPGHTYEHTAYIGRDEKGADQGAFTGGALLMGSAGRSDLLGPDHTAELTRLQWETARRIRGLLTPAASIFPTHGAGSFCSTTGSAMERCGPLATELERNPALTTGTLAEFSAIQHAAPAPIPGYYQYMSPLNRRGPKVFGVPPVPVLLSAGEAASTATTVIDVRRRLAYARAHVPGSLEIEESNSFLAYVGWLVPFNESLVLITEDAAQAERVTVALFRIGYEDVRGYLPFSAWQADGRPVEALTFVDIAEARDILRERSLPVVDTRFAAEHRATPLAGAIELPFDQVAGWSGEAPDRALIVCASGQRATMAASALNRAGKQTIALVEGGAEDLR